MIEKKMLLAHGIWWKNQGKRNCGVLFEISDGCCKECFVLVEISSGFCKKEMNVCHVIPHIVFCWHYVLKLTLCIDTTID